MASRMLRKLQLGKEATAGTLATITTLWRGPSEGLRDDRELTWVPEDIGVLAHSARSYYGKLLGGFRLLETPLTFEQGSYVFQAGIKKVTTPAADGVGSGKVWAYDFATSASHAVQTFSVEGGDDQAVENAKYGFCTSFELTGEVGQALALTADWAAHGPEPKAGGFTGSIAVPTVEEVLFHTGKLYVDDASGNFGTTLKSDTLLVMSCKVTTGLTPRHTASGSLEYSGISVGVPEIELDVTFEHNATAVAEKANWRARTERLIRLAFEGSALTTGGTAYQKKTFLMDIAGQWSKFDVLDEINGNDVIKGTFVGRYLAGASKFATFTLVNEQATLP